MSEAKTDPSRDSLSQHPVIKGLICGGVFFIAVTFLIGFIPPAWAVSIPIGKLFVIDIGDLPPWIASLVALAIWWDTRQAKKKASEAAKIAATVSVQIDGLLADRDKAKVAEGKKEEKQAGVVAAEQLAEGQRQGRETERASVAAHSPTTSKAPAATPGKQPIPVADERTAEASERVASATERSADATVRVAAATEGNPTDGKK